VKQASPNIRGTIGARYAYIQAFPNERFAGPDDWGVEVEKALQNCYKYEVFLFTSTEGNISEKLNVLREIIVRNE
jgi:hypothetical protein